MHHMRERTFKAVLECCVDRLNPHLKAEHYETAVRSISVVEIAGSVHKISDKLAQGFHRLDRDKELLVTGLLHQCFPELFGVRINSPILVG